jgi:hypothetical protein
MNPAAPDGAPPRRISDQIRKNAGNILAPPYLEEALERGTLAYINHLLIFMLRV